jgi:hypothetical protein
VPYPSRRNPIKAATMGMKVPPKNNGYYDVAWTGTSTSTFNFDPFSQPAKAVTVPPVEAYYHGPFPDASYAINVKGMITAMCVHSYPQVSCVGAFELWKVRHDGARFNALITAYGIRGDTRTWYMNLFHELDRWIIHETALLRKSAKGGF